MSDWTLRSRLTELTAFLVLLLAAVTSLANAAAASTQDPLPQPPRSGSTSTPLSPSPQPHPLYFEREIRPVLMAKCGQCHGDAKQSAQLNLSRATGVFQGSESGPVIVRGNPDESLLYQAVRDGHMPPEGHPRLSEQETSLLAAWIRGGARTVRAATERIVVTDQQIIPVLLLRCVPCHGGRRAEAELDLRTRAGILRGGKSGPAVVSGDPSASRLIQRIEAEEMPPRRQLVSVSVKTMESDELQLLKVWIIDGLTESSAAPDVATTEPDRLVSEDDREFWSFQPVRPVALPSIGDENRNGISEHPIDLFVQEGLSQAGLTLAPEADRRTLIRRLSFDLLGLPPRPEDVTQFVSDPDPQAWERLVDRLLASPHYGERWARHWLDVAGYADSEGSQNEDRVRGEMWRYRDYVIRAFNQDKPYDRFLHEQLAGDELTDYRNVSVITDEIYDNLVATGFLRTAPDRTFANITNFVPDRLEVIADEMQILGTSILGLTLHCARCHSHKFDPIPQRDYYRIAAVFKDALDEHDWLGPDERRLKLVTTAERQAWEQSEAEITRQVEELQQKRSVAADETVQKMLDQQIREVEARRQPEPLIRALWSRGEPSPTFLLQRGNYLTPGPLVGPGVLSVLTDGRTPFAVEPPWPDAGTTGRRLAFARWLTSPDHPLTARVMVNRIWMHHFGQGIVTTPGNFGKTGSSPSHPRLLDWLAGQFVQSGWSIKQIHRLILTSATWRQTSRLTPERQAADPDHRWLSSMPIRRLEAEIVRDALLSVSGQLDLTPFGPADKVDVRSDGLVTAESSEGSRRSIYVLHRRTTLPTLLETFDSPQMGPNCLERSESTVATQALHLLNNAAVHQLADAFASRVQQEAGESPEVNPRACLRRAHEIAYGSAPDADEIEQSDSAFRQLQAAWRERLQDAPDSGPEAARRALANYCHAILNTARFIYVD